MTNLSQKKHITNLSQKKHITNFSCGEPPKLCWQLHWKIGQGTQQTCSIILLIDFLFLLNQSKSDCIYHFIIDSEPEKIILSYQPVKCSYKPGLVWTNMIRKRFPCVYVPIRADTCPKFSTLVCRLAHREIFSKSY